MTFRSLATLLGGTSADTGDTPGEPAGTRFVGFGESLTSAISNRPHYALAENTDDLNTRIAPWETGGIDTAYDLGAAAVPGGGRVVTKDAGAIETVSALASYYGDDPANAHFRADATGDTLSQGGGYDFKGNTDPDGIVNGTGWAGYLDRRTLGIRPAGFGSYFAGTENVDLNPGGAASSSILLTTGGRKFYTIAAGPTPSAGSYCDIHLQADLVEIVGSAANDGLYLMWALGTTEQRMILRNVDGSTPVFGTANESVTATFYRVKFGSFGTNFPTSRGFLTSNVLVSDQGNAALGLLVAGDEGDSPSSLLLESYFRQADGSLFSGGMRIDRFGRMRYESESGDLPESYANLGLEYSRYQGGAFVSRVDRDGASAEIGHYVISANNTAPGRYDFMSLTPLEIAGTGLDSSIPFDFVANSPTEGRVDFTAGAGLGASWQQYLTGARTTVVEILTGNIGSQGFYLLDLHDTTSNGRAYLVNLDGTIPTHFPTSTSGTLRFYLNSRVGRTPTTSTGTSFGYVEAFPTQNTEIAPDNVMQGGISPDSVALVLTSPGNVGGSDDRALLRAFVTDYGIGAGPLEIFGIFPGDGPGGPEYGRTRVTNLVAQNGDIRVNGGDFLYCASGGAATTRARTVSVNLAAGDGTNWTYSLNTQPRWIFNSAAGNPGNPLTIPLHCPRDGVITSVDILLQPAQARATETNRLILSLARHNIDWTAVSPPSRTYITLTGAYDPTFDVDDGTTDLQVVTLTPTGGITVSDTDEDNYYLEIQAASPDDADEIFGVRINFNDPGPRNY